MKKNYILVLIAIFATIGIFVACHENVIVIDDTKNTSGTTNVKVVLDASYIGNTLSTSAGEIEILNSQTNIYSNTNDKVQTFVVNDGENVFLMARSPIEVNSQLVIDAQSTALALVTMYPLFSSVDAVDYKDITSMITSSDKYPALYDEVSKLIAERRNIYDVENESLLVAFSNLIEDLCSDIEEEAFNDTLVVIENRSLALTRAKYESARLDPTYIDADITGNKLTLRTVGLTPTYFGTVTSAGGYSQSVAIRSRSDFGGMDLFIKTTENWRYGEPMVYSFNSEGEFYFNFSRMTPEATADFFFRLANCLTSALGLDLPEAIQASIGHGIEMAMVSAGTGVNDLDIDPMDWVGIAYEAILNELRTGNFLGHGVSDSFMYGARFLAGSLNWYNRIKGIGNAATRLAFAVAAPETFNFCLCNYANVVNTCTEANIELIGGNDQTGYAKQKLLEPLRVYVQTIDENGMYVESSNYHRVKYEVTKGGGKVAADLVTVSNDNTASVEWTLGESGEQEVRAVVIDVITEKEISEAVYFSAAIENAEVTIRLNWSKHSCNTDIDLHVVDPYGEEIYYRHMESASGGYLDRDDTVGPGPEHVKWTNAPAGTYKIYVHYFPNEAEDRSITSYTVTVNTSEGAYRPAAGSIAYNQMIGVGQFTIGEQQTRSTISAELKVTDDVLGNKVYPKK